MNNRDRTRFSSIRLWLVPAVLLSATAATAFAGWWVVVIVCACASVIAALALILRQRPTESSAPIEIKPDQAAALRAERERAGQVAAVRRLRTERPELSLVDAVRLVRGL